VFTNKHKYRIIYTDDDTYLTLDPAFTPTLSQSVSQSVINTTTLKNTFDELFIES
jgi:hypothetical protein